MTAKCANIAEELEELANLVEAVRRGEYCCLRYGLPYVRASDIASLALCPLRKHYEILNYTDDITGRAKNSLQLLARAILKAKKTVPEKRKFFLDTPIASIIQGVPVIGRPTALLINDCKVVGILLARQRRFNKPSLYDRILLQVYAALVDYSPLTSTTTIKAYLVQADGDTLTTLLRRLAGLQEENNWRQMGIISLVYERSDFLNKYHRLLDYWKNPEIKPLPNPSPQRCKTCPYYSECPVTL